MYPCVCNIYTGYAEMIQRHVDFLSLVEHFLQSHMTSISDVNVNIIFTGNPINYSYVIHQVKIPFCRKLNSDV